MNVLNIIVNIVSIACAFYLVGLLIFVLVKFIKNKISIKKELKKYDDEKGNKEVNKDKN